MIPGNLMQMWQAVQEIVNANGIVIMQAANTGLTEGSTRRCWTNQLVTAVPLSPDTPILQPRSSGCREP